MLKLKNSLMCVTVVVVLVALITFSDSAINGAVNGMIICSQRIIPSLFPFTAVSVFLYNGCYLEALLNKVKYKQQLIIFTVSCLGGYPIGAKLIAEAYSCDKINGSDAEKMLCYCVNVGPAFSISVVGNIMFNSSGLGVIIFIASIISALELLLIFGRKSDFKINETKNNNISLVDNFVNSVASSSSAMITVCSYIILFATAVNIIKSHINSEIIRNTIIAALEVTTAINECKSIYLISFLIGFGGLSIFMQVLSLCKGFKPKIVKILFSRILNGLLMLLNVFMLLKLFKIDTPTISNGYSASPALSQGNLLFSVLFMFSALCLIYSLKTKKYSGNLSKDIF